MRVFGKVTGVDDTVLEKRYPGIKDDGLLRGFDEEIGSGVRGRKRCQQRRGSNQKDRGRKSKPWKGFLRLGIKCQKISVRMFSEKNPFDVVVEVTGNHLDPVQG